MWRLLHASFIWGRLPIYQCLSAIELTFWGKYWQGERVCVPCRMWLICYQMEVHERGFEVADVGIGHKSMLPLLDDQARTD